MATVSFTSNLQRHLDTPEITVSGDTVQACLSQAFSQNLRLKGYVLDDQGRLRKHVAVFVDGQIVADRKSLSDAVAPSSEIYVAQALSGG